MFEFLRGLPRDNYPDDTESRIFQQELEKQHAPSPESRVSPPRRRMLLVVMGLLLLVFLAVVAWQLSRSDENEGERTIRVTATPTEVPVARFPLEPIGGEFPAEASQLTIKMPARVSNNLTPGAQQGYTFNAHDVFLGQVILVSIQGTTNDNHTGVSPPLNPGEQVRLHIYGPEGVLLDTVDGAEAAFIIEETGQYAVLVEGQEIIDSGTYTISIHPIR